MSKSTVAGELQGGSQVHEAKLSVRGKAWEAGIIDSIACDARGPEHQQVMVSRCVRVCPSAASCTMYVPLAQPDTLSETS
jgi:hypothetical protein